MIFDLSTLNDDQRAITQHAIDRCFYPFARLREGLQASVGRDQIPVEWADLSRWASGGSAHQHVHQDGDEGHLLVREQALGLAWYSGKVSVEQSLVNDPELAGEVFLSEAAHMVDFFDPKMTPARRERIFRAYHGGDTAAHDHGWFEETGNHRYWDWVGESFMGGFVLAYSDYVPSLGGFTHPSTVRVAQRIKRILTPRLFALGEEAA